MKKGNLKKVLAVSLSATLALSASAFAGAPALQADAAAKFVGLNTTFKTLRTGQKDYKLRLVNNTAGWKVKKVTTSDKSICAVYGKKASYVLLKGKSEGRAVVKVSVKTAKREKNNTKTLRCKVNVIAANPSPDTPDVPVAPDLPSTPDASTSAQVSTQAELNNALAKSGAYYDYVKDLGVGKLYDCCRIIQGRSDRRCSECRRNEQWVLPFDCDSRDQRGYLDREGSRQYDPRSGGKLPCLFGDWI